MAVNLISPDIDATIGGSYFSVLPNTNLSILVQNVNALTSTGTATIYGSNDGVNWVLFDVLSTNYDLIEVVKIKEFGYLYFKIKVNAGGSGIAKFNIQ